MSFYKKYRIIIIIVAIIFVLSENNLTGPQAQVSAITDAQREEIERLRNELNEAFDAHEIEAIKEKGIVVQPEWLQESNKPLPDPNSKVTVTDDLLREAELLRDEINKAITDDAYVASVRQTTAGNSKGIKELELQINSQSQKQEVKDSLINSNGSHNSETINSKENVGASVDYNDNSADGPNIVDATGFIEPDIDIRKLQRLEVSKRRTKEVLVLESIEEDFSFDLGNDVEEWEHIMHGGEEYFIGRRIIDLLIVRKNVAKYESGKVLHVGEPISYLETYSYWNTEQQHQEGVILVSSKDKVLWYRADNETGHIELYWEWTVGSTISGLTFFTTENREYLAISSNQSSRSGFYALNIYQFELHSREFWIAQRMQLQYPCGEVTILDTGRDIILAVVQNNTVNIYTFNPHVDASDHIRFKFLRSVPSEEIGIESIAAFQMGGRSYLAFGGLQPQIMQYQQGDLVPKTILGSNFGNVELFFPIPARSFRDDLILLVQHRVAFGTHGLEVLETLIWDGEAFEASIPVPCQLGDHLVYGASCMLDIQRSEGLKGSALLRRNDEIYVIVPRDNTESGLFKLHIKLLAKNSEIVDLQEIFAFLQDWVREQDELISSAEKFLQMSEEELSLIQPDLSELESLTTPELIFNGKIDDIRINDYTWTEEDSNTDLDMIMNAIEELEIELNNPLRQKRNVDSYDLNFDKMDLNNIEVEELEVEKLNNEDFFIQNNNLDYDGILNITELKVLENAFAKQGRQIAEETLEIDEDVEIEFINGISWSELKENIIFRNEIFEIDDLEINGEVIIEDQISVEKLNDLNFPDDYLWSTDEVTSVITAEKTFKGTLAANAVDINGLVNGANPIDAITLSDPQDWTGTPTFKFLEVTEKLELNGTIISDNMENVPVNPTLNESNTISADCIFQDLVVQGDVHLKGSFDSINLESLLQDIVQRPDDPRKEIIIPTHKSFTTQLVCPIDFNVVDGKVNNISVDQFMTRHTKQDINLQKLQAYVYFNKLSVTGVYDGVDIEDFEKNSIKIDEMQHSPNTQLNFVGSVTAKSFNVNKSLNGIFLPDGYQTIQEDLQISTASFQYLNATVSNIAENITGTATLNGINLVDFLSQRDWYENSTILRTIHLNELILENNLEAEQLYGIKSEMLLNFLKDVDDLPEMILEGKLHVDHIIVTGDVKVNQLNNKSFDGDIQSSVLWLNRPNYLNTDLNFLNTVHVKNDVAIVGDFNGNYLPDIIDDIVFHNISGNYRIIATKSFVKDIYVHDLTNLDAINSLPFDRIANKQYPEIITGSLHINGNLIVNDLNILQNFNDYPISSLQKQIRYDPNLQNFVLLGKVNITNQMELNDLMVYEDLNEFRNMAQFFDDLILRNSSFILKGQSIFTGRVSIHNGVHIDNLNGLDIVTMLNNIVFINEPKIVLINTPISFKEDVVAHEIVLKDFVKSKFISGCCLDEWLNETLRVDGDENITKLLKFGPGSLDVNDLEVSFLNEIDMKRIVTLHTEQKFSSGVDFNTVYLDGKIITQHLINDVNLKEEFENTVMTHGNQHITTPLTVQSIQVLGDLITNSPINGDKDLRQLISLEENIQFESPLFFQNVNVQNIQTNDSISGINFQQWYNETLWANGRPYQYITGNWSINTLNVQSEAASQFNYMLNNAQFASYDPFLRSPRKNEAIQSLTRKVSKALKKSTQRRYHIKHFESISKMKLTMLDQHIDKVFSFKSHHNDFLLINSRCDAFVYEWQTNENVFKLLTKFKSGSIDDLLFLRANSSEYGNILILNDGNDRANCNYSGLNLWHFQNNEFEYIHRFMDNVTSIITNEEDEDKTTTFYATTMHNLKEISIVSPEFVETDIYRFPNVSANSVVNTPSKFVKIAGLPKHKISTTDYFLITNGLQIVLVPKNETSLREKRRYDPIKYALPLYYQRSIVLSPNTTAQSFLKPTVTTEKAYKFSDFKNLVERILVDLVYRLNLEVNITQLSIPEEDLFDEHLVIDFLAIMEELQKQQIFPEDLFADLNLDELSIPDNPAQVLAVRTVQIIWPVIIELQEIHGYLKHNASDEHPICACIATSLGTMIREILILANRKHLASESEVLMSVIERIRRFQKQLEDYASVLSDDIENDTDDESLLALTSQTLMVNKTFPRLESEAYWANFNNTEIVTIEVGPTKAPYTMLVIINSNSDRPVPFRYIMLYMDPNAPILHQSIEAYAPHSLVSIRIRDDTLLAFIDGCCTVRVLIYRGLEGFIEFNKFSITEGINQLRAFKLISTEGHYKYYLGAVMSKQINFYEVVIVGSKEMPINPL